MAADGNRLLQKCVVENFIPQFLVYCCGAPAVCMTFLQARAQRINLVVQWPPILFGGADRRVRRRGRTPKPPEKPGRARSRLEKAPRQNVLVVDEGHSWYLASRLLDRLADHSRRLRRLLSCFLLSCSVFSTGRRPIRRCSRAFRCASIVSPHSGLAAWLFLECDVQHPDISGQILSACSLETQL